MGLFHLMWSIIIGFVTGLLARAVMPGADHIGFIATTLVGIVGSVVGGFIGGLIWKPQEGAQFHRAGLVLSVIGAMVVLYLWRHLQ